MPTRGRVPKQPKQLRVASRLELLERETAAAGEDISDMTERRTAAEAWRGTAEMREEECYWRIAAEVRRRAAIVRHVKCDWRVTAEVWRSVANDDNDNSDGDDDGGVAKCRQ